MSIPNSEALETSVSEISYQEAIVNYYPETENEEIVFPTEDLYSVSNGKQSMISYAYTPEENIGEQISPQSVIGGDTRSKVLNPSVSPYSKIVFIRTFFPNGYTVRSSGVILGPDLVLTCAHSLYVEDYGGWATKCLVFTDVNGSRPNDSDGVSTIKMTIPSAWRTSGSSGSDWGYVITNTAIGNQKGWMGFGYSPTSYSVNYTISGYPLNEPYKTSNDNYYMYTASGKISLSSDGNMFDYEIDTSEGQSGSPLYTSGQIVYGIHVLGGNHATKISPTLYNYLVSAKNEGIEKWSD